MALSWCRCAALVLALALAPAWAAAPSRGALALTPENEVPLRPAAWLREGKVTSVPLPKDRTRRFYFAFKKTTSKMSVTVVPCDSAIEWSLAAKTMKDKPSKSAQWTSKKSVPEVWWRGFATEEKMHAFAGDTMDTYTGQTYAPASIYILKLKSKEQDTKASVYLQDGDGAPAAFPQLPPDARVRTVGVGMTSVTLTWMPSDSVPRRVAQGGRSYRYCVLVNRERNYGSVCAAQEAMKSNKRKAKKQKVTAWPILKEWWWRQWDAFAEDDGSPGMRCACGGTENVCTVSELLPDTPYYFDVFVLDALNGTGSAYAGTFARTHEEARPAATPLGEGELRWVALRGGGSGRRAGQLFSFRPRGWQQSALLTLQSCGARKVKVTVSKKGQVLASQVVGEALAHIWLQGKPSYEIRLEDASPGGAADAGSDAAVKMQISSAYHRQAVPALPATLQIKSFNKLRGCDSVTLAWLGTEERSLYCVYRRKLGDGERPGAQTCLGPESRGDAERVLCKYFQELNPRRAVTTATVGGLEPGTAYLFDVYLMRRWGIPVKYRSKAVRTRKEC